MLGCLCPSWLFLLFKAELWFFGGGLVDFRVEGLVICIFKFIPHLISLLLNLLKSLRCLFLLFLLVLLLISDTLFELFQPFFMIIEYRQYSLFSFVLVVLLNWHQADLLMRENSPTKLPKSLKKLLFFGD